MSTIDPYKPSSSYVADLTPEQYGKINTFDVRGRIGRLRYFAYTLTASLLTVIVSLVLAAVLMKYSGATKLQINEIAQDISGIFVLMYTFMLTVQRAHDFNKSGWLSLIILIPFMQLLFLFVPGTNGPNKYGPPPPPNTAGTVALTLILPGIAIIGLIAVLGIPFYQGYEQRARALHDPDYRYRHKVQLIVRLKASMMRTTQEITNSRTQGHLVTLPTGKCGANVSINSNGTVKDAELTHCASADLGKTLLGAIKRASPFSPVPDGKKINIAINIVFDNPRPGSQVAAMQIHESRLQRMLQHLKELQTRAHLRHHQTLNDQNQFAHQSQEFGIHDNNVYNKIVARTVLRSVRKVRIEQEKTARERAGHPVPLATGHCTVRITIRSNGALAGTRWHCKGTIYGVLGPELMTAVHRAVPFPRPPLGGRTQIAFGINMNDPTPGVAGK